MFEVVRAHPQFRKIWIAQVASQGGDWLSRIAVLATIARLSGGDAAVGVGALYGVEVALRLLPTTLLGPVAGPVADRLPRKFLMLGADFLRTGIVLSLLLIHDAGDLPLLYVLIAVQMGVGIFFDSARSGAVPSTVPREELHAAYALSAATWSTMLAVGSMTGGILVEAVGPRTVFVLDAATYLVSAALIFGLEIPRYAGGKDRPEPFHWSDILLFSDLRRGLAHVRSVKMLAPVLAKTFWGPAGGYLVLISVAASERFASAETNATFRELGLGSAGVIGLFYCARGLGTALGPILARSLVGSSDAMLRRQIVVGYAIGALGYAFFATTENLVVAFLCIAVSHMGGSTLWVASTTLWQKHVDDAFRGRVFTLEFLGMTFAFSLAGVLTGFLYDRSGRVDVTTWAVCTAVALLGAAWTVFARRVPVDPD